jgi:plasmid stability protein
MELTVKITPRVAAQVARRLRLAASVRSRSMSAMVNDALDDALPSLEEIRMQLAAPAGGESGLLAEIIAGHPGPVTGIAARSGPGGPQALDGGTGDGSLR